MKHLLLTTIAAVLLVGCGESHQSAPQADTKPAKPVAEGQAQPSPPPVEAKLAEPVAEAAKPTTPPKAVSANEGADPARGIKPEPPPAKAPEISIHDAASKGNIAVVKQHLSSGTDVNKKDEFGATPLHYAAFLEDNRTAQFLISNNANVNAHDNRGMRPLDNANRSPDFKKTTELIRKNGGKSGAELFITVAASIGNLEAIKKHLNAGVDVNAIGGRWNQIPLHYAVNWGHMPTVKFLIDNGANVNAVDGHGETPLHAAAFNGRKEIMELLISNGANINAKNRPSFKTPLDKAIKSKRRTTQFPIPPELEIARKEIAPLIRKHGGKTSEEIRNAGKTKKEIKDKKDRITCVNNLKKIGTALRIYAIDNEDFFPWQVPQAKGGTAELAKPRSDSSHLLDSESKPIFDVDAWVHFQALNNQLQSPSV